MKVRSSRRNGLTLMELVVVLLVLVGLAGILVPMLPSMLTRTHVATHTTNVVELSKAIQLYQGTNNKFPDQWDSMVDATGNTQITYLAGGALNPTPGSQGSNGQAGGMFTVQAVQPNEAAALNAAGIFKVHNQVTLTGSTTAGITDWANNPFDPTFANYAAAPGSPTAINSTTLPSLTFLTSTNPQWAAFRLQNYPSWSATANYVVLGIGPRCTLIGTGGLTPPVHFSDTQDAAPEFSYGRFVAIFKVSDPNAPGGINMAQFVGVAAIHAIGINNLDSEFQNYNQINNGGG